MTLTANHICGKRINNKQLCDSELVILDEISNIRLTHPDFEFALEINDVELTVTALRVEDNFKRLSYKDKFVILNVHQVDYLPIINRSNLVIGWKGQETVYTFKSQKQLLKFLRRLTQ